MGSWTPTWHSKADRWSMKQLGERLASRAKTVKANVGAQQGQAPPVMGAIPISE